MEKKATIPHYRKLYEILRTQIIDGIFIDGKLLPSENELCAQYKLTRPTIRHALDSLANEGLIKKHKGKGSIVLNQPKGIGILSIAGTTSAIGRNKLSTTILSKPKIIQWPQPFIFPLSEAELQSGCIYIERLRLVDNVPLFYDLNYLPNINLPRFISRNFENKSLFDILRKHYQIEVKGGEQKFRATLANEQVSNYLQIPLGRPILQLERKIVSNRLDYCFYSSLFCNTDDHTLYGTF